MKLELVENRFRKGIQDGVPIGLGYLSVSFTFGMMAVSNGIPVEAAVVISLTNVTSAGQFSGLTLMLAHGSYVELALSQFIINLRYALMSLSLTQKVDRQMKTHERALIAYGVTDEIFALASSTYERVGKWYMAGLIAFPVFCWTLGTFLGGAASTLLPEAIRSALGIAIYGMFLAIIIPIQCTGNQGDLVCDLLSAAYGSGIVRICLLLHASHDLPSLGQHPFQILPKYPVSAG